MSIIAIIPARYQSSRFPGKPLASILNRPMIQWVVENLRQAPMLDAVYVATDDQRIYDCVESFGGNALMTSTSHSCGTDRLAECCDILCLDNQDIVLNIQGDEPLINHCIVQDLYSTFEDSTVYMGTLKKEIHLEEELNNPNVVKVITDVNQDAIYFSRYCIPYVRDSQMQIKHYKHIGVYGYKVWFLKDYSKMAKTNLEIIESLEQLRVIENGYKIRVKETKYQTIGVDIPEQIKQVETELLKRSHSY